MVPLSKDLTSRDKYCDTAIMYCVWVWFISDNAWSLPWWTIVNHGWYCCWWLTTLLLYHTSLLYLSTLHIHYSIYHHTFDIFINATLLYLSTPSNHLEEDRHTFNHLKTGIKHETFLQHFCISKLYQHYLPCQRLRPCRSFLSRVSSKGITLVIPLLEGWRASL